MANQSDAVESLIAELLQRRDITDEEQFFNPLYYDISQRDPFKIPGVVAAVERLGQARRDDQRVVIYGDYDIDGLTATALLHDAFTQFGFDVLTYTPDRFAEGYGLNKEALSHINDELKADVVVTVDCGTVSFAELEHARDINLEVIVTDHHQPKDELPPAVAVVNPHRADNEYPFVEFAGVGVAFKLVQALQTKLDGLDPGQEKWLLDLVALGTVCDVVPLVDENRALVHWGLKVLAQTRRVGLRELMLASGVEAGMVRASDLGFRLGPRLNASGRLTHAKRSLSLLMSNNQPEAAELASELEQLNQQRRSLQSTVLEAAAIQAETDDQPVLVVAGEDWNEGVIGIVAARLLEMFEKPSFVFAVNGEVAKASARAYGDFSAVEAIRAADEILISGGGHKAAGGCSIAAGDVDQFRQLVNDYYQHLQLKPAEQRQQRKPEPDVSLQAIDSLTPQLLADLAQLEPFGQANPEPLFEIAVSDFSQKLVGKQRNHLKLRITAADGQQIGGILFGRDTHLSGLTSVIGYLTDTSYDRRGVELIIKDYT